MGFLLLDHHTLWLSSLNGPPITDKKKNDMDEPQRGFYVTVTIDPYDFDGINDCGEPFQELWLEKNNHDHVRVIALDDDGDLNSFSSIYDFVSWFYN